MTSEDKSLTTRDDPFKWSRPRTPRQIAWAEKQELVRQQLVREYSKSSLYQAAAAKDPEYWNNFSMGCVHLYEEDED